MANKACNGIRYMIRKGDTLYKISRTYRVPLALILRANPYVDVYNLQIGDEICIPLIPQFVKPPAPGAPNPFDQLMIYVIQAGDTLESILTRFGLSLEDFLKYNQADSMMLQPGTTIQLPEAGVQMAPARAEEEYNDGMGYPGNDSMMIPKEEVPADWAQWSVGYQDGWGRQDNGWMGTDDGNEGYEMDEFVQEDEEEPEET